GRQTFHIVTTVQETRGTEIHALELRQLLKAGGRQVCLWSDTASPYADALGVRVLDPLANEIPAGGTLIILGTWISVDSWIERARTGRLILICNMFQPDSLRSALTNLDRPFLPSVELVFVSRYLREAMRLPGRICPALIDRSTFKPKPH